jgi:hypothetical protein
VATPDTQDSTSSHDTLQNHQETAKYTPLPRKKTGNNLTLKRVHKDHLKAHKNQHARITQLATLHKGDDLQLTVPTALPNLKTSTSNMKLQQ